MRTAKRNAEHELCHSDAQTEASTCRVTDMDYITDSQEQKIYDIISNDIRQMKYDFSIHQIPYKDIITL